MIEISHRFAPALLLLGFAALAPVALHHFRPIETETCRDPGALLSTYRIEGGTAGTERYENDRGDKIQWTEGELPRLRPRIEPLHFAVLRSFRPTEIYLRPAGFVVPRFEAERRTIEWIRVGDEELPIHFERGRRIDGAGFVAYLYLYEGKPVLHPFRAQLRGALGQIVNGARPLTMFIAGGTVPGRRIPDFEDQAKDWLASAWHYYAEVCSE